jgi:hypothetical protein
MAERGGPVIRLQDGPGAGWQFYEDDFLERIRAAQRIWSRQRNDLTDGFRDIAAAAVSLLPDGVVLDGVI